MTPTEQAELNRWAERIRDVVTRMPSVRSDEACERVRMADKWLTDAINTLEDGLPF